ncbi:MAG: antibiotic biosynthesis monooxygenase, partial [Phycisphaerae bacterium]
MSEGFDAPDDGSVTWVITHQVHPDRRDDFEDWIAGIADEVARFPGREGVTVLRPGGESSTEYVVIIRFASYDDLRRWEESAERAEWLTRLDPLLAATSTYRTETGLETWFQLPGQRAVVPPPKWKMALLIIL